LTQTFKFRVFFLLTLMLTMAAGCPSASSLFEGFAPLLVACIIHIGQENTPAFGYPHFYAQIPIKTLMKLLWANQFNVRRVQVGGVSKDGVWA